MSEYSGDQVHPATPARREQARRDGEFAKSHELAAAVQMTGAVGVAYLFFGQLANWLRQSTTEIWSISDVKTSVSVMEITGQFQKLVFTSLLALAPIVVMLLLAGIASHWCQTGPLFLSRKIAPDVGRLSPTHWVRRLFSVGTLAIPLVGLPKTLLAAIVMMVGCWCYREQFFLLGSLPADQMVRAMFLLTLKICSLVALMLLVASLLDYGTKYLSFQQRIRMSDQQLRDEVRMQNGDPRVSAQRRELQRSNRRVQETIR